MSSDSEESYDSLPKDPVHFGLIREKWEVASILTPGGVGPLVSNPVKQRRNSCVSRQIMCPTDELMLIPDHVSPSAIDLEFTVNETDMHEKGRTQRTSIGFSYFQALDVKNSKEENINDQELVADEYLSSSSNDTSSEILIPVSRSLIKEVNVVTEDLDPDLSNTIHYSVKEINSEIEASVVIDTLTRSIVEDSDEIEGNTTLIVKENKENEKIVEIENIFDEDIDADSKDVTLIENLSIKDIIVDEKSNESVSDTNVDESVEKDLSQDIDNKHQIVREDFTVAASDDLNCSTTESVLNTTSEEDIVTKLDNNHILQGNILCQDSTKLRLAAYMDDNLKGSNELCCISLLRASDDADVGVIIPVDPFEISPSDVTNPVQSLDHGEKKVVISDSANGHTDSSNINQINSQGHITTLNIGLIQCLDDNQTVEFIGDVQSLEQNNLISEETHEVGSVHDVLSNDSGKMQDNESDKRKDNNVQAENEFQVLNFFHEIDNEVSAIESNTANKNQSSLTVSSHISIGKTSTKLATDQNTAHMKDESEFLSEKNMELEKIKILENNDGMLLSFQEKIAMSPRLNADTGTSVPPLLHRDQNRSTVADHQQESLCDDEAELMESLDDVLNIAAEMYNDNESSHNSAEDDFTNVISKGHVTINSIGSGLGESSVCEDLQTNIKPHLKKKERTPIDEDERKNNDLNILPVTAAGRASDANKYRVSSIPSDIPKNASPLPEESDIGENGYASTRMSIKRKISKEWRLIYYAVFNFSSLYIFRSKEDFEDWKENPYHNQEERNFLVKYQFNFLQEFMNDKKLKGYKQTEIRKKVYHIFEPAMFRFKLERWITSGVASVVFFACLEEREAKKLRNAIQSCLVHCPYQGFHPTDTFFG